MTRRWGHEPDDTGHGEGKSLDHMHAEHEELAFTDWLTELARLRGVHRRHLLNVHHDYIVAEWNRGAAPAEVADVLASEELV